MTRNSLFRSSKLSLSQVKQAMLACLITFLLSFNLMPTSAAAGILKNGDAAVTGFSGIVTQNNSPSLDPNGPSLRVFSLPNSGPFGLRSVTAKLSVPANQIGQVFGVALDHQANPTIYVAATSAYGLNIQQPDGTKITQGSAAAEYVTAQFGAGGGPNSIWRIDGVTGNVTLFANVSFNGLQGSPASLGGLTFDPASQQLFVADRGTGMIHRFSLDGTDLGIFDHGQQGRSAAGLPPVAFDPKTLADITSPSFDVTNPNTWGYAVKERRVYALAAHAHRLYYAVAGSQVWSVGIAADRSFANDARLEVEVPAIEPRAEIASIAFDQQGNLYTAERGFPTGDQQLLNLANSGQNRVLRFKPANDPAANGYWISPGEEYAVGMPPDYQNANGGVDLNCAQTLWMSGERLLDTSDQNSQHIDGLQGNDASLVKPKNTPPYKSWYVNYYDHQADPNSRGHLGALQILKKCEVTPIIQPIVTPPIVTPPIIVTPPVINCPSGTIWVDNSCVPYPICPPNTYYNNGYCVYVDCPWGYIRYPDALVCVPPPIYCPIGTVFFDGQCYPYFCPWPLFLDSYGYCRCRFGTYYYNGRCNPVPYCPDGKVFYNGHCVHRFCGADEELINGRCMKQACQFGEIRTQGKCIQPCPKDQIKVKGTCTPLPKPIETCKDGKVWVNGQCTTKKPIDVVCPVNQVNQNGQCVPKPTKVCPVGQSLVNGTCVKKPMPLRCGPGQIEENGQCITKPSTLCPVGQSLVDGVCTLKPTPLRCGPGQIEENGHCVTKPTKVCPVGQTLVDGVCVKKPKPTRCGPGQVYRNGYCVTKPTKVCPVGQTLVDGVCVKKPKPTRCGPGQVYRNGYCVTKPTKVCPVGQTLVDGVCVKKPKPTRCGPGQVYRNGQCVTAPRPVSCPDGQVRRNGRCVTIGRLCPPGTVLSGGQCVTRRKPITQPSTPIHTRPAPTPIKRPPVIHPDTPQRPVNTYQPRTRSQENNQPQGPIQPR